MAAERVADIGPQETHLSHPFPQKEQPLKALQKVLRTNVVAEAISITSPDLNAYDFLKGQIMANADRGSRKNPNVRDNEQHLVVGVYPNGISFVSATFLEEDAADFYTEKVNNMERSLREIKNKERFSKADLLQEGIEIRKDSPEYYSISLEDLKDRLSQSEVYKLAGELFLGIREALNSVEQFETSTPLRTAIEFIKNGKIFQVIFFSASRAGGGPSVSIRSCGEGKDIWKDSTENLMVSVGKLKSYIAYSGPDAGKKFILKDKNLPLINTARAAEYIKAFIENLEE